MTYFTILHLSLEFGTDRWQFLALRGEILERYPYHHGRTRQGDSVRTSCFDGLQIILVIRGKTPCRGN